MVGGRLLCWVLREGWEGVRANIYRLPEICWCDSFLDWKWTLLIEFFWQEKQAVLSLKTSTKQSPLWILICVVNLFYEESRWVIVQKCWMDCMLLFATKNKKSLLSLTSESQNNPLKIHTANICWNKIFKKKIAKYPLGRNTGGALTMEHHCPSLYLTEAFIQTVKRTILTGVT